MTGESPLGSEPWEVPPLRLDLTDIPASKAGSRVILRSADGSFTATGTIESITAEASSETLSSLGGETRRVFRRLDLQVVFYADIGSRHVLSEVRPGDYTIEAIEEG